MCLLCFVQQIARIHDRVIALQQLEISLYFLFFKNYLEEVGITFITTLSPFSAKIRGANSEPRYASRLYRALVAKSATAGVGP